MKRTIIDVLDEEVGPNATDSVVGQYIVEKRLAEEGSSYEEWSEASTERQQADCIRWIAEIDEGRDAQGELIAEPREVQAEAVERVAGLPDALWLLSGQLHISPDEVRAKLLDIATRWRAGAVEDVCVIDAHVPNASPKEMGREMQTTFWEDFAVADGYGPEAVEDTCKRGLDYAKDDAEHVAELALVLNWRMWLHHDAGDQELYEVYLRCWQEIDQWAVDHLHGEDLATYEQIID